MNVLGVACLYLSLSLFGPRVQQLPVAPVESLEDRGEAMLFEISVMALPFDRIIAAPFE